MTNLSPLESEFETTEAAEAYEAWLRAKLAGALASPAASVPHVEAMTRLRALLDRASPLSSLHHFHGSSAFRRPASDPFDRCRWNSRLKALFLTCDLM
jgi:hypothetical protein